MLREAARHTYGADAAGYREGRPDYPPRLYEVLRSKCGLGPGSRVLEIGPGSGLVTEHLVAAGARVVAVEPDRGFAEYLGRNLPEVQVVAAPFEEADVGTGFDAVVAATSFHWLDPSTALRKVGGVLRPGGWGAIWWKDLRRGAGLVDVAAELIPWDLPMTAVQVRALFGSMITIRQLPDDERARALDTVANLVNDRFGGVVTRRHLTALYTGRKAG